MSERETEDEEELVLPITEPAGEALVDLDDVPDDWLEQPDFDPAGRPL